MELEELTKIVTDWNFKKGGCCGEIARHLINKLESAGFCFTSYYELMGEEDIKNIKYLYEKRTVAVNGIPHENIHLFDTDMMFIGIIDIPMSIYEQGDVIKNNYRFKAKAEFKGFKAEDIKFKGFKPMKIGDYMQMYYHAYLD